MLAVITLLIISNIKFNLFAKLISFYRYPNNEIIKSLTFIGGNIKKF